MGPIPGGHGGKSAKKNQKKKGSKSGNPAKRAAEEAANAQGAVVSSAPAGSGFGLGGSQPAAGGPSPEELESLQKFLGR
jgi:signal recognition particle subunit SRP54